MTGTARAGGVQVPCDRCPLRKLPAFRQFTPEELDFMMRFKVGELNVAPGASVILEGIDSPHLYTVLSGWMFRHKTLPDGRRQILNFLLPGDLIGVQMAMMDKADHSVEALTSATLCVFARDNLWTLYRSYPELAYDVTWLAAREERLLDNHLLSVGRRTAEERLAYLLVHLFVRADKLALTRGASLRFPLTQQHLADALGLSLVHTNRTLHRLIRRGLLTWRGGELAIASVEALADVAGYVPAEAAPRPFL